MRWPLLAALFALAGASCSKPRTDANSHNHAETVTVTVVPVETIRLDRTIPIVGTLYPKDEATIAAEVEGRVEKTLVDFGDRVTGGQELAQIDTITYEALANQAAANLAKAKATAANAEQNLKRIEELRRDNIASQSDLDKAVADAEQARAEVQAAEASAAVAQINLRRSRVKAPFDCAIAERMVGAGDFVHIGTPLFHIVNDRLIKYITSVPERYSADIKKELPASFTVDAYPGRTFQGSVLLISPAVNTKSRALTFGILVQNGDLKLKANSYARGELILERDVPTLVVPIEAVVNFSGINRVFVLENGEARVREVQLGKIKEGKQEILNGLKNGETIVVTGHSQLHEGAKVIVRHHSGPL